MTNNNYTEYEDELFYSFIDDNKQVDSNKITLPAIVQTYRMIAQWLPILILYPHHCPFL